jgi:hypothetical protein
MLGNQFTEFAYLLASETRGDALIACRRVVFSHSDEWIGCSLLLVRSPRPVTGEPPWWLTTVYGPQADDEKVLFLEELEAIRDECSGPWIVAGDFSLILTRLTRTMRALIGMTWPDSGVSWTDWS